VFCHCQRLRRHRSAWLQTKFIIATEKARKVLDAADAKVVDCGLHLLLKLRNGTNRSWDLMSTIADSAAFPHWVEHDQLLMTAYNACRASAVIALQYLGRLAASQQDAQKRVCELVATTKREQQNMLSDLYFTCYSQEGWGLYQWLGPKHGTNSRIALRVSARITQYRLVWTDHYRERDWGTGARSGGVIHAAGVLVGSDV